MDLQEQVEHLVLQEHQVHLEFQDQAEPLVHLEFQVQAELLVLVV